MEYVNTAPEFRAVFFPGAKPADEPAEVPMVRVTEDEFRKLVMAAHVGMKAMGMMVDHEPVN